MLFLVGLHANAWKTNSQGRLVRFSSLQIVVDKNGDICCVNCSKGFGISLV